MLIARLLMAFLVASAAVSARAASFDCIAPAFPTFSSTSEGARRVEKQVLLWRKCHADYRAEQNWAEVARMNTEVETRFEKWAAATRDYSVRHSVNVQAKSRLERKTGLHAHSANVETRIERDEKKIAPK